MSSSIRSRDAPGIKPRSSRDNMNAIIDINNGEPCMEKSSSCTRTTLKQESFPSFYSNAETASVAEDSLYTHATKQSGLSNKPTTQKQASIRSLDWCNETASITDESLYTHVTKPSMGHLKAADIPSAATRMNTSQTTLPVVNTGRERGSYSSDSSSPRVRKKQRDPSGISLSGKEQRDPSGIGLSEKSNNGIYIPTKYLNSKPGSVASDSSTACLNEDNSVEHSVLTRNTNLTDDSQHTPFPTSIASTAVSTLTGCTGFSITPPFDSVAPITSVEAPRSSSIDPEAQIAGLEAQMSSTEVPHSTSTNKAFASSASGVASGQSPDSISSLPKASGVLPEEALRKPVPFAVVEFYSHRKSLCHESFYTDQPTLPLFLEPYLNPERCRNFLQAVVRSTSRNHSRGTLYMLLGLFSLIAGLAYLLYGVAPTDQKFISVENAIGLGVALMVSGLCMLVWGRASRLGGVVFRRNLKALCDRMTQNVAGITVEASTERTNISAFCLEIFRALEETESTTDGP